MEIPRASDEAPAPDLALIAPGWASRDGFFAAPFSPATWRAVAQVWVSWAWLMSAGLVVTILAAVGAGTLPALGLGLPLLVLALYVARGFATAERARLLLQAGVDIGRPVYRAPRRPGAWSTVWAVLTDDRSWAHVLYAFVGVLLTSVTAAVSMAAAGGAVAFLLFPGWGQADLELGLDDQPFVVEAAGAVGAGLVLTWVAALVAQGGTLLLVRLAAHLLGPSGSQVARAAAQVAERRAVVLQTTRTLAVDAADTERRRIERDLHDGAQQRLVALGVELGSARRRATADPEAASAALEHAHREIKETLAELRDLVRGIHPAVLADRGLDAALSSLAARSPVPVRVDVPDPASLTQAGPTAQAAAYFVVAEALTNVAKHADARTAGVRAEIVPGDPCHLRVVVSDDGRGGADLAAGSGLVGLRGRVAALDGTFHLDSPTGAGTRLTVEVPCAS
ncbi:sensor histidine kinase [Antribacter gilvus]|uniref:sensor histidine kinase n=1 Tax=Antribacter gilvus TaxID=2304675 RepID=UPI000F799BD8|nr:sensor histidine kinase [Antribacter gilvus]